MWLLCVSLVLLCGVFLKTGVDAYMPIGCEETDTDGEYECDFRVTSIPMSSSSFTTQPQHVILTAVSGSLPAQSFKDLAKASTVFPIPADPNRLDIICLKGSAVLLNADTFKGSSWVDILTFTYCEFTSLPEYIFQPLSSLDTLDFIHGSIDDLFANSLTGLSIAKDPTLTNPKGRLSFQYTTFIGNRIPSGFLTPITAASEVQFIGNGIATLDHDTFAGMGNMTSMSLSGNDFTVIPLDFFTGLTSLDTVHISDIPWDCSACGATWVLQWAYDNFVSIEGSLECDSPASMAGERMRKYHMDVCSGFISTGAVVASASSFDSQIGMDMSGQFLSIQDVMLIAAALVVLTMSIINAVCLYKIKKVTQEGGSSSKTSSKGSSSSSSKVAKDKAKEAKKDKEKKDKSTKDKRNGSAPSKPSFRRGSGRVTPTEVRLDVWS